VPFHTVPSRWEVERLVSEHEVELQEAWDGFFGA